MQSDKSCPIVEQYLAYLITIKGRSKNTILEYRLDLLQFFRFIANLREIIFSDFRFADIEFIRSIQLGDMYSFLVYCQDTLNSSIGTRARKIISIRQFWKYLKTKAHLIENWNVNSKSDKNYKVKFLNSTGVRYPSEPWMRKLLNQFT